MAKNIATYHLGDLKEGDSYFFKETITEKNIDDFASLSGDYSTLHLDEKFAQSRGFQGRVVHGGFLIGLLSRLVGMHFPGENAVLQSLNVQFLAPAYSGDTVRVGGEISQVSQGTRTIVLKAVIENAASGAKLVRGKIQVGFSR